MGRIHEARAKRLSNKIYNFLLIASAVILLIFGYLSYIAFSVTVNTPFVIYAYIIISPVAVSIFLFAFLLYIGRGGFYKQLHPVTKA